MILGCPTQITNITDFILDLDSNVAYDINYLLKQQFPQSGVTFIYPKFLESLLSTGHQQKTGISDQHALLPLDVEGALNINW